MMIIAGDIGGTNTRLAFFENGKNLEEKTFPSKEYSSLEEIVKEFKTNQKITKACFGIAGPVREGKCQATNLPWVVDRKLVEKSLDISPVFLINDLEANAYGIRVLEKEEFCTLNQGKKVQGNQALIAAGTGLGEAGLYWNGKELEPFACEGGHTDFAPRNEEEVDLLFYLKKKYGHVSYERVISGPGLHELYLFITETKREKESKLVKKEMEKTDPSKVISTFALKKEDLACEKAVDLFISCYGAEAGNLALKFLSFGGLFIGGGIAPVLLEKLKEGIFMESFADKGRFKDLMLSIPVNVILNKNTALLGAAYYGEHKE